MQASKRGWFWAMTLGFFILATVYSLINPLYEAPDEPGHVSYILELRNAGQLPVQGKTAIGAAHHAPLYYGLAALFTLPVNSQDFNDELRANPNFIWGGKGQEPNLIIHTSREIITLHGIPLLIHLARLASVLMGTLTIALLFDLASQLFPQNPAIALLASGLVALNPQFLFISGAVNNDNLITLAVTGLCWQMLGVLRTPQRTRQWFFVGLWLAAATLAKVNALLFISVVGLLLFWSTLRQPTGFQNSLLFLLRNGLAVTLPVLVLTGWWFARNLRLYGDLMGWSTYITVFQAHARLGKIGLADVQRFFSVQFKSFWGVFGWLNLFAPDWYYTEYKVFCLLGGIGLIWLLIRPRLRLSGWQQSVLALFVLMIIVHESYMLWAITKFNGAWFQGRYLFPVIAPLAVLCAMGLVRLMPMAATNLLTSGLLLALGANVIYVPLKIIMPTYPIALQTPLHSWQMANQTDARFGQMIALQSYQSSTESTSEPTSEQSVNVELCWRALQVPDFDYIAFVHLVDPAQNMVAQQDRMPGQATNYTPRAWRAGDLCENAACGHDLRARRPGRRICR